MSRIFCIAATKISWGWVAVLCVSFMSSFARATPQIIRVTGTAYDSSGNPASGSHTIFINAYAASTGGTSLWTSSSYSPTLTKGIYNIDLDTTVGSPSLVQRISQLPISGALWLEINYDGNTVRPRMRARGTTFALSAASTDGFKNIGVSSQTPSAGNILVYNGTNWVPSYLSAGALNVVSRAGDSMSGSLTVNAPVNSSAGLQAASVNVTGLVASKLILTGPTNSLVGSTTNVTNVQLNYLQGVTADVQMQLIGKQSILTVSSMQASAPLALTGAGATIGAPISITLATASSTSSGVLLASDWNAFNGRAANAPLAIARAGDTMTGVLNLPYGLYGATLSVSALAAGNLVRTDAADNLTSVTTAISDAQFAYLNAVTAMIQPQINALASVASVNPPGTISAYAGGTIGNTAVGSNQITALANATSFQVGQQIAAPNIPHGTLITSIVSASVIQISSTAMSSVTSEVLVIPPAGYLLCDGSTISRSSFSNLYENIGNAWGQGDGSTTFNLPDLRGKFLRGQDWGAGVDGDSAARLAPATGGNAGDKPGSYQAAANGAHTHAVTDPGHHHALNDPGHSHSVYDPGHAHAINYPYNTGLTGKNAAGNSVYYSTTTGSGGSGTGTSLYASTTGVSLGSVTTGIIVQSAGGSEARPINSYVNYIIKY